MAGETLCAPDSPVVLEKMDFPEPVIKVSVEPKTKSDQVCQILCQILCVQRHLTHHGATALIMRRVTATPSPPPATRTK